MARVILVIVEFCQTIEPEVSIFERGKSFLVRWVWSMVVLSTIRYFCLKVDFKS